MGSGAHNRPPTGVLENHLRVKVVLHYGDGEECQALALVDSGAEVCLVRKGLLPDSALSAATSPLRIVTANSEPIDGGDREADVEIRFNGIDVEKKSKHLLLTPTRLIEADVDEDVILSYQWMGERDVRIGPRPHGVWFQAQSQSFWVEGVRQNAAQRANARLPRQPVFVNTIPAVQGHPSKLRALDLFCGEKSAACIL